MSRRESGYRNEAHRFLSCDIDPVPLVRGIQSEERARVWLGEANRVGNERVVGLVVSRLEDL